MQKYVETLENDLISSLPSKIAIIDEGTPWYCPYCDLLQFNSEALHMHITYCKLKNVTVIIVPWANIIESDRPKFSKIKKKFSLKLRFFIFCFFPFLFYLC